MHVTRVTEKTTKPAAAAGANAADLLSALLAEDPASPSGATFPVTLQEAIAEVAAPVDAAAVDDDAAVDAAAVDDATVVDDGAAVDDGDATSVSLEVALAAAGLDLGTATNAAPEPDSAGVATDGTNPIGDAGAPSAASTGNPTIVIANVSDGQRALVVSTAPSALSDAAPEEATGKQAAAGQTVDQALAPTADGHDASAALPTATPDASRPVPAGLVATESAETASAARSGAQLDAAGASLTPSNGERAAQLSTKGGHAPSDQQPRDGIVTAAVHAPFSIGGDGRQALDLGTPDRQQGGGAADAKHVATTVGTTATGRAPEALPLTTAATAAEHGDGAAPSPPPPAGPTHTTTAASARSAHASTTASSANIEARWGERVADALRLSAVRGGGEIRLQLEPEGLGHIDVRVHLQSDGVRAVIVAEHESTRALLQSQQHVLEDALSRSDVRLSGFSVDVGSGGGPASFAASSEHERGGGSGDTASPAPTGGVPDPVLDTNEAHASGRLSVRV